MRMTEIDSRETSDRINKARSAKIENDIAAFRANGGVIKSIPRGVSGNVYSARPLTKKQQQAKLNETIRLQNERPLTQKQRHDNLAETKRLQLERLRV